MGPSRTPTSAPFSEGVSRLQVCKLLASRATREGGRRGRCSDTAKKRNVNDVPEMVEIVCSGFCVRLFDRPRHSKQV
jgi:hypothetical protein